MHDPSLPAPPQPPFAGLVPRDRVTPDDLNVAPELLGAPLARPARRLVAIGIDVAIVALLSDYGNVWLLAGVGLIVLVHLRDPLAGEAPRRKWLVWTLAVALIGVGAQQVWTHGLVHDDSHEAAEERREAADEAREAAAEARGAAAARTAATPGDVIVGAASAAPASAPASASASASAPGLTPLQAAEVRIALLENQLAQARAPKPFNLGERIQSWADDVGLGLGWAVVYFAVLPVWWNGQTIGKRLLGLRVVELTGKPITAMRAFKRYGGYAAGMATGMFGFAQVLWDPNRQAIQDKTAHTVVIDLRRPFAKPPVSLSPISPHSEPPP